MSTFQTALMMIAWNPKPFIFVHIPKSGGTSVEAALIPSATGKPNLAALTADDCDRFFLPVVSRANNLQHSFLGRYADRYPLDALFKFAFVRNPWDRAVSQINYLRISAKASLFSGRSFKDQLYAYCNTTESIWDQDLGASQIDYLLNANGTIGVDFIGRFESLVADFAHVACILGLKSIPHLPHLLSSKRREHYSSYYDAESANWIRKRFASDIDHFGYRLQPS